MEITEHVSEVILRIMLYVLFEWINSLPPFMRYIEEEELWMYRYPSRPSMLPKWTLYFLLILIPSVMFLIEFLIYQKPKEILQGVYALSLSYTISGIVAASLKCFIGRPRPDFYMRCFPDGYGNDFDNCTGTYANHMDGRRSFPSAHTTFAFSGMVFMTMRMCDMLRLKEPCAYKGWKCIAVCLPVFCAMLIAISRICDYHHHYSDVLCGSLLGSTVSYFVYSLYYWSDNSDEKVDNSLTKSHIQ